MAQSIIIPHRNRHLHLATCLRSIGESAAFLGRDDFEVIVVDDSNDVPSLTGFPWARLIHFERDGVFWKTRLLNMGMDAARHDTLTVLDADAVVGRRWLESADAACDVTKVCYRVRMWPMDRAVPASLREMFAAWDACPCAFEGWGHPARPSKSESGEAHGNSQLSITREALRGLRYDEQYRGHGREDIDFNVAIWARHGDAYRGHIWTDPEHAMFHLSHAHEADWRTVAGKHEHMRVLYGKWRHVL